MIDTRLESLHSWLTEIPILRHFSLTVASSDASFRRYFRIQSDNISYIAMDADPAKEDSRAFVAIAKLLLSEEITVPEILYSDFEKGFFLISDLGHEQLLSVLTENSFKKLYQSAIKTLVKIQSIACHKLVNIPSYGQELLVQEMLLFRDWFLEKHLGKKLNASELALLDKVFSFLKNSALEQHQVLVHRDYHSRNLMDFNGVIAVLDFQDAVIGPFSYDLVSLLRDCYIDWPDIDVYELVLFYKQLAEKNHIIPSYSESELIRYFNLMGIQRHLKAVGIFSRLNYRDNKPAYLADIPRTLNYIQKVSSEYPELFEFNEFLKELAK